VTSAPIAGPDDVVVAVRGVHSSFGRRVVFRGLDIVARRGRITAIMGPSGTGKTTLLRLITGQLMPDQGSVTVWGQDLATLEDAEIYRLRQRMGMLFQNGALLTDLDVFENVAFPVRAHTDLPEAIIRDLVLMKLQAVGLRGAARLMPAELSGGMARRVALARAIVMDPELLIYDEPFVGLDPISMGVILRLIREMNEALGITSIVVSHDVHELGEIADEAGLPPGVLNIVTGDVAAGEELTRNPMVDLVSFTGSDAVGSAIMAQAAPTLKRLLLELGGKSALIVREDADLDMAAQVAFWNITCQAGQGCCLFTRHLVHHRVKQAFTDRIVALAQSVKLGDPADPGVAMGPLIRAKERDRVAGIVDTAVAAGAQLLAGGRRPAELPRGYFYEPTLLTGVENSAPIARKEVFGPVGVIIGFDDDDHALKLANDSPYGLGGGIISADKGRAFEMAQRLDAGFIILNEGPGAKHPAAPFGGLKRSGIGRESGSEGLDAYTEQKSILFRAG